MRDVLIVLVVLGDVLRYRDLQRRLKAEGEKGCLEVARANIFYSRRQYEKRGGVPGL